MTDIFVRQTNKKEIYVSKIVTVLYFENSSSFVFGGESHDFWELVYVDRGTLAFTVDGQEQYLQEGEILFHKPNEYHVHTAKPTLSPDIFIISFECKNEAIRYFEDRHMPVDKSLLRFIFAIIDESKRTFDLPYSDPELKKMKLLESPALGGQQLIKNYLELLLINLLEFFLTVCNKIINDCLNINEFFQVIP
jgi:hypothetical protein